MANGLELDVIAAVIIGGGSLSGGRGTVLGTLLGATTMAVIQIGCAQKGYPNWVQQIVTGAIIVLAVALDRWRQGKAVVTSREDYRAARFSICGSRRLAPRSAPTRCTAIRIIRPPT